MEKNRRALIGLAIFGILILVNVVVRLNRPRPAAVLLTPPGATAPAQPGIPAPPSPSEQTPAAAAPGAAPVPVPVPAPTGMQAPPPLPVMIDPTQPIAQQLSGISTRLSDLETRLATLPAPLARPLPGRTTIPERDLFHWPGSVPASTGTATIVASGTPQPPSQPTTITYLGTITRGERSFVFLRVDSRAYLLGEDTGLPGTSFRITRISSTSADIISDDGTKKRLSRETDSDDKVRSIASLLKGETSSQTLELRWILKGNQASGTQQKNNIVPGGSDFNPEAHPRDPDTGRFIKRSPDSTSTPSDQTTEYFPDQLTPETGSR